MKKLAALLAVGFSAISLQSASAALNITPVNSGAGSTLINNILGSGITVSSFSYVLTEPLKN